MTQPDVDQSAACGRCADACKVVTAAPSRPSLLNRQAAVRTTARRDAVTPGDMWFEGCLDGT